MMENRYIYEYMEDYQIAETEADKKRAVMNFCAHLWESEPGRRAQVQTEEFDPEEIQDSNVREIFREYSKTVYWQAITKTKSISSMEILKQRINNLYTIFCDRTLCLERGYLAGLMYPLKLFKQYTRSPDKYSAPEIARLLKESSDKTDRIFRENTGRKMDMTWPAFKRFVEDRMVVIFQNYQEPGWDFSGRMVLSDFINTDHYLISYISSSLTGYLKNERLEFHGIRRGHNYEPCHHCGIGFVEIDSPGAHCIRCAQKKIKRKMQDLICAQCGRVYSVGTKSRRSTLCPMCYTEHRRKKNLEYVRKFRSTINDKTDSDRIPHM